MKIYKSGTAAYLETDGQWYLNETDAWDDIINRKDLYKYLQQVKSQWMDVDDPPPIFDPPVGLQEIWASGVTYMRSKKARMEESKDAGGGDFYDRVYDAERPELFMKGMASRAVGQGGEVYIRKDSTWNVPEPELTLFISSEGTIEGYTIGNDMSSRSIEGENPLYLPQAKVYDKCAGLGPCIYVPADPLPSDTNITLKISRGGKVMFDESILINQIKRSLEELVYYLYLETTFEKGCFLMTGTGIVPPDSFTLEVGDVVDITIEHIGTLTNVIGKRP